MSHKRYFRVVNILQTAEEAYVECGDEEDPMAVAVENNSFYPIHNFDEVTDLKVDEIDKDEYEENA